MFERSSVAKALQNNNVRDMLIVAKAYLDEIKKFQSIDDVVVAADSSSRFTGKPGGRGPP